MAQACLCEETYPMIDQVIEDKGAVPDSLIEILHGVQQNLGYLPEPVQEYIAHKLRIAPGTVEGVVTFYSFFTTVPRGRHTIKVCQGTACYVRGGKRVLETVAKHAGTGVGSTSEDMKYSLDVVRCIGACGLAPVMTVDDDIYDRMKPARVSDILDRYE